MIYLLFSLLLFIIFKKESDVPLRGVVFIVHGLGEHCHRYDRIIDFLTCRGMRIYSFDHRGHGRTHHLPENRKQGHKGHIDVDKSVIMQDIEQLIKRADDDGIPENIPRFLLGHSLGGLMVIYYALTHKQIKTLSGLIGLGKLFKLCSLLLFSTCDWHCETTTCDIEISGSACSKNNSHFYN